MFYCPPQNCTMAQYFSQPLRKPGRNVFSLFSRQFRLPRAGSLSEMVEIIECTHLPGWGCPPVWMEPLAKICAKSPSFPSVWPFLLRRKKGKRNLSCLATRILQRFFKGNRCEKVCLAMAVLWSACLFLRGCVKLVPVVRGSQQAGLT